MKKPLFSLICAVALLFSSCSKENTAAPKYEKLYPVTFNVSTFSKEIVPMASLKKTGGQISASTASGTALNETIKYINYVVYNESGTRVNFKSSGSDDVDFGKIEDRLPKGKYNVVFIGSTYNFWSLPEKYSSSLYLSSDYGDLFFKTSEIVVSEKPLSNTMNLERIGGKVEIVLTEEIPTSIQEIQYSVTNVASTLPLNGSGAYGSITISNSNYYHSGEGMTPDYTQGFNIYFLVPYSQNLIGSVNIRAYDHNRNLVADKTITDVPLAMNTKTILTGRLFDDVGTSNGQEFSISVDDKWNSESNHVEF